MGSRQPFLHVGAVTAGRIVDQADLDKKYTAEMSARLVKLVGMVRAREPSAKAGSAVDSLYIDNEMTP